MSKAHVENADRPSVLERVAVDPRREIVTTLDDRDSPVRVEDLATLLAATVADEPLVDVTREERDAVLVQLTHSHLPALEQSEVVRWDAEAGIVESTEHPALSDETVRQLLAVDAESWETVLSAIGDPNRRRALSLLETYDDLERVELARRLVDAERDGPPAERNEEAVENAQIALEHVHLPALAEADLIEYGGGVARYVGHPELDPAWLTGEYPSGTSTPDHGDGEIGSVDDDAVADEIRVIEGREAVITRGQELVSGADDELFMMITSDGLLEEECIDCIEDAVDRGVDVYVGSQTAAVRDLVRRRIPGATIWEPQLDWLNLQPDREHLGRLVFADRRAVMLGTIGADEVGDVHETALTAAGDDDALVVMLRETLGSRLDHLDHQSEDLLSYLQL